MHEFLHCKKETPEALAQTLGLPKFLQARRTTIAEIGKLGPDVRHYRFFLQKFYRGEDGRGVGRIWCGIGAMGNDTNQARR